MYAQEFITIKNKMDICKFYDPSKYYDIFIANKKDYNCTIGRLLVTAFCELENKNKYPESSDLNDLIKFVNQNPEAKKLNNYINNIPGYTESLYCNQPQVTYYQHRVAMLELNEIKHRSDKFSQFQPYYKLDNIISLYLEEDKDGIYLNVNSNGVLLKVEKLHHFNKRSFKINGIMFEDIEINELINIINYATVVKELNLKTIQVAYNFLR
jgi:hypothetical protein